MRKFLSVLAVILTLGKIIQFLKGSSLTKAAYNTFLEDVQRQINKVKVDNSVTQCYVLLVKESNNAVAYLIKRYDDGRTTRTKLNVQIDVELLPEGIEKELRSEGSYQLYFD